MPGSLVRLLALLIFLLAGRSLSRAQSIGDSIGVKISRQVGLGNQSFETLKKKVASGSYGPGPSSGELSDKIDTAHRVFNGCYQSRSRWTTARLFDSLDLMDYVNYIRLLEQAAFTVRTDSINLILDFITAEGKLKWAPGHQTSDDRLEVTVKVIDSLSRECSGYIPFCKPFLSTDSTLFEQFDPTNFAKKRIKAGWKLFWIEKNGKLIATRQEKIYILDKERVIYFQNK
jgi:hypothetical protein